MFFLSIQILLVYSLVPESGIPYFFFCYVIFINARIESIPNLIFTSTRVSNIISILYKKKRIKQSVSNLRQNQQYILLSV
jgi:hypothetical protein